MTQLYFLKFFVISECYVLTSMAYDRYVAICNPLLYNVAMSPKVCSSLMLGSYFMAFAGAMVLTECTLVVKNPPANAEDIRDTGSIPGSERSPGGGHDIPLQYS